MSPPAHLRWTLPVMASVLVLDAITKRWIMQDVLGGLPQVVEVTGFFNIVWVWNQGVSFGMLGGGAVPPLALKALAGAIVIGLALWLWRADTRLAALALALVIGGAIGNIIDRALWGAVFDFLDFHAFGTHFPAFNMADSAITIGVGLLLYDSFAPRSGSAEETQ